MNTTLQIRIERKDKIEAQKIFNKMGMDLSSGIKTFIKQVISEESLPFQPRTVNGMTKAAELRLQKDLENVRKSKKVYSSIEDMFASIEK
ncbi:MAG: type II toxin-antitoxin system RelB/DinJ family antitoxin [bacterium]